MPPKPWEVVTVAVLQMVLAGALVAAAAFYVYVWTDGVSVMVGVGVAAVGLTSLFAGTGLMRGSRTARITAIVVDWCIGVVLALGIGDEFGECFYHQRCYIVPQFSVVTAFITIAFLVFVTALLVSRRANEFLSREQEPTSIFGADRG